MKFKKIVRQRLVKVLVTALLIGSVANTGFTVQAEEILQDAQDDIAVEAGVSGNAVSAVLLANETVAIATQKKYPTINTVILAGGRLAKWMGGQSAARYVDTNNYRPANSDFSLFAGHKMTLDDASTFYQLSAYNTGVDENGIVAGSNGARWQCVGFVAFDVKHYTSDKPADLLHYVYYNGDSEGTSYYEENCGKSLEDVTKYIQDNNGILYGEAVSESFLDQLIAAGRVRKEVTIATVWYVTTPTVTWTNYDGYHYEIPGVSAVDYYEYPAGTVTSEQNADGATFSYASEGVTITTTPKLQQHWESGTGRVTYDATITITIHSNAPDKVKINLSDAIGYLNGTVAGGNAAEPGDTLYYNLKLVNESNKEYEYDPATAKIGTIPAMARRAGEGVTVLSRGFEGYEIGEVGAFCTLPRRILNAPLRDLGITAGKVTDSVVGEALLQKGYGNEAMSPEEVTRSCLAQYYLDWFNNTSREEDNKAYSFWALTAEELAILTNGTADTTVPESCAAVADALYYTAYHNVYTFDGKGLYDRMLENGQEGSYADTLVSGLLKDGEAKITANLNGVLANNGYQMTRYGFGMQFELSREPEVTPPVTTSPTPSATPTATPSTTPVPTPTATPSTTPTPAPTATPGATPTATPTATPSATPAPTPSTTPVPTPSATPTATPTPDTPDDTPDDSDTPDNPGTPVSPVTPVTPGTTAGVAGANRRTTDTPQVLGARRRRMVTITDDPVPLSDKAVLGASRRPKTGDASHGWNLGFALSLTGLGAWLIMKKKQ